jgi:hypothetical protein
MADAATANNDEIRRQSKTLSDVFLIIALVMAGTLLASRLIWPLVSMGRVAADGEPWRAIVTYVGVNLIEALPAVLLLLGVLAAQRVFARISEGAIFTAPNVADIGRIGENMVWAAIAAIVISPTLAGFVRGDRDVSIDMHDWTLLLGVLGAAIGLLGRVLALANQIKAENEQII